MAYTNKTAHYDLPQWIATDKPSYLGDQNQAYLNIDTAIFDAKTAADTASTVANSALGAADAAKTAAEGAETTATSAVTKASEAQTAATQAMTTATEAQTAATNAATAAGNAQTTANTAKSTADTAQSAAQAAAGAASTAQTRADSAYTLAQGASTTAGNITNKITYDTHPIIASPAGSGVSWNSTSMYASCIFMPKTNGTPGLLPVFVTIHGYFTITGNTLPSQQKILVMPVGIAFTNWWQNESPIRLWVLNDGQWADSNHDISIKTEGSITYMVHNGATLVGSQFELRCPLAISRLI